MPTNKPTILVTGGAGFIGSHMVLALVHAGYHPLVLDNFSHGHRDAVPHDCLIVGDMGDKKLLAELFATHKIAAVMHFGGLIQVAESVQYPAKYYQNNVAATLNLLEIMLAHHVNKFIFSSTAAVYGEPQYSPMDEQHPIAPLNPYGRSKQMVEEILRDYEVSDGLQSIVLRYFNAAGADPSGRLGERHEPESHLIPLVLQVAMGKREKVHIYGDDYPTKDGTCIRDYVHVSDLCDAHLLALKALLDGRGSGLYNLGTGHGFSVREVIAAVGRVTGEALAIEYKPRRAGDSAVLVADAGLARKELGWEPRFENLATIVGHAWGFMGKVVVG